MSAYRTITVNASFGNSEIGSSATLTGGVDASGEFASVIRHNSVNDYNLLDNKPQINSVTLQGNKSLPDIGVGSLTNMELEQLLTI